jgi:hypothetical protein
MTFLLVGFEYASKSKSLLRANEGEREHLPLACRSTFSIQHIASVVGSWRLAGLLVGLVARSLDLWNTFDLASNLELKASR